MALIRFRLDLAIPQNVFNNIPAARKLAFRDEVRALKALAVRINEGLPEEEMTVKAKYHVCHHDTGDQPCEEELEI
uniref:Uncharacterized protein n=1 Tax=viral metagenome TaxID=1070528 RepID=A0A6M3IID2_9ZZZZ